MGLWILAIRFDSDLIEARIVILIVTLSSLLDSNIPDGINAHFYKICILLWGVVNYAGFLYLIFFS